MAITTRTGDTHEEFFIVLNKYASFNVLDNYTYHGLSDPFLVAKQQSYI